MKKSILALCCMMSFSLSVAADSNQKSSGHKDNHGHSAQQSRSNKHAGHRDNHNNKHHNKHHQSSHHKNSHHKTNHHKKSNHHNDRNRHGHHFNGGRHNNRHFKHEAGYFLGGLFVGALLGDHYERYGNRHYAGPIFYRNDYGDCFRVERRSHRDIFIEVPNSQCRVY